MTKPWDHNALLLKARLFLNHAMDQDEPRTFDERALWASLALELLAKAALARVSPVLIAVPSEEGNSLLVASGLIEGDVRFTSVPAKTLFARCAKAFRPFSDKEAGAISGARNDYLHGASPTFTSIPEEAWWPSYWAQMHILANACDLVLDDLVGTDRVGAVGKHLARNARNIEQRCEMLLGRARQRLALFEAGQVRASDAAEWARYRVGDHSARLQYSSTEACPACGALGHLEGDNIEEATHHTDQLSEDDFESWMELQVSSEHFSCDRCRLILDSYELIAEAELPESFAVRTEVGDYWEPEYGND